MVLDKYDYAKNDAWGKNWVQFPRLLAEISATQELDLDAIANGMDLPVESVVELFNRADNEWERIKQRSR